MGKWHRGAENMEILQLASCCSSWCKSGVLDVRGLATILLKISSSLKILVCLLSVYVLQRNTHACILADLLINIGKRQAVVLEKFGCSEKYQAFLPSYRYLHYNICHVAIIFRNLSTKT